MKICILGLDCAAPEILFGDERLANLRRLMDLGVYGILQTVSSPTAAHAWHCLSTGQETSPDAPAICDLLAREGKRSIVVGVPSNQGAFISPPELEAELHQMIGEIPPDVDLAEKSKTHLKEEILAMSRQQWQVVQQLLQEQEWDYFHFVDIGLERIQRVFYNDDKPYPHYRADNPRHDVIPDYYLWLDEQLGAALELLDSETVVLVVSCYAPQFSEKHNDANYRSEGTFILFSPNCPLNGECQGAHLRDMAPTLLDLAGHPIPPTVQGRSLVAGMEKKSPPDQSADADNEKLIRDRLAGLGYI